MLTSPTSIPEEETARRAASTALVTLLGDRVYPVRLPQEATLPAILYFKVSGVRVHSLRGPSGLARPRFQFDAYAEGSGGYGVVKQAAESLRKILDGFRGIVDDCNIQYILLDTEEDPYEEEPELYRVSMDFMVMHNEER